MIVLDLSILNQKGTPMFNSDTLANRPAAGIVGRIFIAIDSPFGIYRDTGSAWDQISGASTFSGSLATGQVAFGSATNTISGTNNLFFDSTNVRFGIRSSSPTGNFEVRTSTDLGLVRSYNLDDSSAPIQAYRGNNGVVSINTFVNNGTITTPTDVSSLGGITRFTGNLYIDGAYRNVARMEYITTSIPSIGNPPTAIRWLTTNASYSLDERAGITANGNFQIGSTITTNRNARLWVQSSGATAATWTAQFHNSTGTSNSLIIDDTGSVMIGTAISTGQRLQVYGDTLLRGSGNTTATTALTLQNSDATNILRINNAGQAIFGTNPQSIGVRLETDGIFRAWSQLEVGQFGTLAITTTQLTKGASGSDFYEFRNSSSITAPNGTYYFLQLTNSVTPTSGIAVINGLNINFTINQTGGANGITRGIRIAPTLTSAADWRSIEWSNNTGWGIYGSGTALNYLGGTLGIKTTSPYAPSTFSLDVNGGLLVKNTAGTTAQITLINADPSIGGNNGFLVASVGGTSGGSYVDFQGYYGTSIVGSTALRLNPAGGAVIVNSTTNSGEQFQLTGTLRINGQQSSTSGGNSGQHLIINLDGTQYKIKLELP
jgi:hypothetical protein